MSILKYKFMAKIEILIEGYAKETEDGWLASSTTTLVQKDGVDVIVEQGIAFG